MLRLPRWRSTLKCAAILLPLAACQSSSSTQTPERQPPVVESESVAPRATPAAEPAAVTDEFTKLLAGMGVRYFAKEKRLEVGGWVNMQSGLVEVFACAPEGKTHESVVVLDCVPSGLHAGLLALGLEPGKPVEFGTGDQYTPPSGDGVLIELRWVDAQGKEHTARAEDWVTDHKREQSMQRAPWIFAGSFLQPVSGSSKDVTFAADYVKSLVTTYHDASSILENPEADGIDDTVYYSNEKAVPPVGTPITAIFRPAE